MRAVLLASTLAAVGLSACQCGEVDRLENIETGSLTGVVCAEATGLPSPDTRVRFEAEDQQFEARTDGRGAFELPSVPAGEGQLIVETEGAARTLEVEVAAGEVTHYVDTACRDGYGDLGTGWVEGTVCNRHVGELVTEADVTLALPDESVLETTTDAEGYFELAGVPAGEHVVTVAGAGFQRSWLVEVTEGRRTTIDAGGDCAPPGADAALVSGALCDPEELGPLQGAQVTATDRTGETFADVTDTEGLFTLGPLAPGQVVVEVEKGELTLELVAQAVAGEEAWVTNGGECVQEECTEQVIEPGEQEDGALFLVVDRSGSMSDAAPGYGTTRWAAMVDAVGSLTRELEESIEFGMMLFPNRESDDCTPGQIDVEPAYGQAEVIEQTLDAFESSPLGPTPTAASLAQARTYLAGQVGGDRNIAVVLATDGGPNCNPDLDPNTCICTLLGATSCADYVDGATGCLDHVDAIAEVAALYDLGIDTYVIGVPGVEEFDWVLDQMAQAGGTALGGQTDFYAAYDLDALESAFADIGRQVSSCTLDLELDPEGAARFGVLVGEEVIERDPDHVDGFDVTGEDTVTLYGAACEAWQASAESVVIDVCSLVFEPDPVDAGPGPPDGGAAPDAGGPPPDGGPLTDAGVAPGPVDAGPSPDAGAGG